MQSRTIIICSCAVLLSGCARDELAIFEDGNTANIIPISANGEVTVGPRVVNNSYAPVEESPKNNNYEAPIKMVEQPSEELKEPAEDDSDDEPKVPVVNTVKPENMPKKADLMQKEIKPEMKAKAKKATVIKLADLVKGGKVITKFGEVVDGYKSDGMVIKAALGTSVHPIRSGTVIYAGNRLKEYGNIVVVKHEDDLISTYAHLQKVLVNKDDNVTTSTVIGTVGKTGDAKAPQLYLQVMKDSITTNPVPKYVSLQKE